MRKYYTKISNFFLGNHWEVGDYMVIDESNHVVCLGRQGRVSVGTLEGEVPKELFSSKDNDKITQSDTSITIPQSQKPITRVEFNGVVRRLENLEDSFKKLSLLVVSNEEKETPKVEVVTVFEELTEDQIKQKFASKEMNTHSLSEIAEKTFGKKLVLGGGKTTENVINQFLDAQKEYLESIKKV